MIVRALDGNGDWTFGKGKNNYLREVSAIRQSIQTRLKSFLGDCFFALNQGIDWFNLLGSKNILELRLAVAATLLNTEDVVRINNLNVIISSTTRNIFIQYEVETVYGEASGEIDEGVLNA